MVFVLSSSLIYQLNKSSALMFYAYLAYHKQMKSQKFLIQLVPIIFLICKEVKINLIFKNPKGQK